MIIGCKLFFVNMCYLIIEFDLIFWDRVKYNWLYMNWNVSGEKYIIGIGYSEIK